MKTMLLTFVNSGINLFHFMTNIFKKEWKNNLQLEYKYQQKNLQKTCIRMVSTFGIVSCVGMSLSAQFDAGMDLYSRYLWRGLELSSSPSFQPWISYTRTLDSENGINLEVGAWGAYSFQGSSIGDGSEADVYLTLTTEKFSLTITDYFFPTDMEAQDYFDEGHSFELMASYEGPVSVFAAYDFTNSAFYAEAAVNIAEGANFFVGVGNEYYTTDTEFNLMNFGVNYTKDLKITDSFSLPLTGVVLWNPEADKIHLAVGVSF